MADITSVELTKELLTQLTFTATAVAGDLITGLLTSKDTILVFKNEAAGAVTVNIANVTAANVDVSTYGRVQKADPSLSVAAGAVAALSIPSNQLAQYLSASKIALTYTSHDVLFKVAALRVV